MSPEEQELLLSSLDSFLDQNVIAEVMGPGPALVDSAQATAEAVAQLLRARGLERRGDGARHRTLCTDVPERFHLMAERFLGRPVDLVEAVDLSP